MHKLVVWLWSRPARPVAGAGNQEQRAYSLRQQTWKLIEAWRIAPSRRCGQVPTLWRRNLTSQGDEWRKEDVDGGKEGYGGFLFWTKYVIS